MMGRTAANQSPFSVSSGSGAIIQFSEPDPRGVDELQEDLNVMSLLLQKKLEEAVGENSLTYRMGIPMLLRSGIWTIIQITKFSLMPTSDLPREKLITDRHVSCSTTLS